MKLPRLLLLLVFATLNFVDVQVARSSQTSDADLQPAAANSERSRLVRLNCDRGDSITRALARTRDIPEVEIQFRGTCRERVVITRDSLTLRGQNESAVLVGLIDVIRSSRVTLSGFIIRHGDGSPRDAGQGGVAATDGTDITLDNLRLEGINNARGILLASSTAKINNVTTINVAGGGFVFRGSSVFMSGEIRASGSPFGMSLVNSQGFIKKGTLDFHDNLYGLIVQIGSGLEHVEGGLTVNNNAIGLLVAGKAVLAHGCPIHAEGNSSIGIWVNELSDLTHLIRDPPLPVSITSINNAGTGFLVEDGSIVDLVNPTTITGNDLGLVADNAQLIVTGCTAEGNETADMQLMFDSKATFLGELTSIATPIQCDNTVLTRGAHSCGVALAPEAANALALHLRAAVKADSALQQALALSRE
ncbi:MAG: hypothetical protein U0002_22265 [Thermoanaerobaculia bacterium]